MQQSKRIRRHKRIRTKVKGTARVPRLCVFRSNKHIDARLIDDERGRTLVGASDLELKNEKIATREAQKRVKTQKKLSVSHGQVSDSAVAGGTLKGKTALAHEVGKLIAKKALEKKIGRVVFDRGGYKYHGRVKALAEGARSGGLKF